VVHYIYRAILAPLFNNPSMAPIHLFVWAGAFAFQMCNAISIGGWLAGYGPITVSDWAGRYWAMEIGLVVWAWGLMGNIFHDDDLREIRRVADRKQRKEAEELGKPVGKVDKVYMMPKNGLFKYVLYAHYLCEWIEWAGFWMVGGWNCHPARAFLVNEITTMLPRALQGKRWYVKKFGKEQVAAEKPLFQG
jgi:3-oxo-5-alpha-steroid 4-dehydrogenase 1